MKPNKNEILSISVVCIFANILLPIVGKVPLYPFFFITLGLTLVGVIVALSDKGESEIEITREIKPIKISDKYTFSVPENVFSEEVLTELDGLASKEAIILNDFVTDEKYTKLINLVLLNKRFEKLHELNAPLTESFPHEKLVEFKEMLCSKYSKLRVMAVTYGFDMTNTEVLLTWEILSNACRLFIFRELINLNIELSPEIAEMVDIHPEANLDVLKEKGVEETIALIEIEYKKKNTESINKISELANNVNSVMILK